MKKKTLFFRYQLISVMMLLSLNSLMAAEQIGIYYLSMKSAQDRNSAFKKVVGDNPEPVVFAKYNDMESFIKSGGAYLIGPSYYADYFPEYEESGKVPDVKVKYLLVSLDKQPFSSLAEKVVGAVAVLDRKELKDFVTKLFGSEPKRIKTVSKPDDLFNYLVLEKPDYIIVQEDNFKELVKTSKAAVHIIKESAPIDYLSVFVKKGGSADKGKALLAKIKNNNFKELGIK